VTTGGSRESHCPVCGGKAAALLELSAQPIYQHPVPADAVVPLPHAVDLAWVACTACGHGWQPQFDAGLLERIYREHYYTSAPDGIAVQFREDFLSALGDFGLMGERRSVVEIGASAGDVLATLRDRTGATHALAFEPDAANAARARQRGLEVIEQFFGLATARRPGPPADLVYARHVIEHVFDFADFLAGVDAIAAPNADLVLETPALDHHVMTAALNPFHIEHVHVFSVSSLAQLGLAHGWRLCQSRITADGNLIAGFRRTDQSGEGEAGPVPGPPPLAGLQERVTVHRSQMRKLLEMRCLVFWGAGSASVRLASFIGRAPDLWTDGNPSKVGKKFVGHEVAIVAPERALAEATSRRSENPVVVIASSFVREILPRVRALGWVGDVVDLEGNRL
jgi:methyltransferase family protein